MRWEVESAYLFCPPETINNLEVRVIVTYIEALPNKRMTDGFLANEVHGKGLAVQNLRGACSISVRNRGRVSGDLARQSWKAIERVLSLLRFSVDGE
jgi:hypothetical protein